MSDPTEAQPNPDEPALARTAVRSTAGAIPLPPGARKYEREVANFVALTADLASGRLHAL